MDRVHAYYCALDDHDYESLAEVLAPMFVHERPDVTLEGRERFVRFMREERPEMDTRHEIRATFTQDSAGTASVAVQGRLLDSDDTTLTEFVDVFTVTDGKIERIETYIDTV